MSSNEQEFFPKDIFGERIDSFKRSWYTANLIALNEPALYNMAVAKDVTIYRFLWLRAWHDSVSITIHNSGETTVKILESHGFFIGEIIYNKTISLSLEQIELFEKQVVDTKFWNQPTLDGKIGLDGAQWIIEGASKNRYHVVDRWSGGSIKTLGLLMLTLSQINIPPQDIY